MTVDIYVRERKGGRGIRVPWLPEEIEYKSGGVTFASYDIMNKGEVNVATGSGLRSYYWKSLFPGKNRTDDSMQRGKWQAPKAYHDLLESWKKNGTPLTILVTGYPINDDVVLSEYKGAATGGFGDWEYEVTFQEDRKIVVSSKKLVQSAAQSTKRTDDKSSSTTYTIKSGDTLWGIAERFLGSGLKWETIYNANTEIIESTAKKYGKQSSNRGWWIYPGTTITIPQ